MKIARAKVPGFCCLPAIAALVFLGGCGAADGGAQSNASHDVKATENHPKVERVVSISVDGHKGPQTVGIVMAEKLEYFDQLGIDMTVTSAVSPEAPLGYVESEVVDFGVTRQPQLVIARDEGSPVTAVGALVPRPTAALISLKKTGIEDVADLKGKTVAVSVLPFQQDLFRSVLEESGLKPGDVKKKNVVYELAPALLTGDADAIFGGSWNLDAASLAARGEKPVVLKVQDLGVPDYAEQVVVARSDWAAKHPQLVKDVMGAIARGTAAAVEDPEAAVEAIELAGETEPGATPKTLEAQVEATIPLLSKTGYMSPAEASKLTVWMHKEGWIKRVPPNSRVLTNKYLSVEP